MTWHDDKQDKQDADSVPIQILDLVEIHRTQPPDEKKVKQWCRRINTHLRAHKLKPMDLRAKVYRNGGDVIPADDVFGEVCKRFKDAGIKIGLRQERHPGGKALLIFTAMNPAHGYALGEETT